MLQAFNRSEYGRCFNPTEAGHYVTTVGKLFTPTVPSRAESRLNQLAPGTAAYLCSDHGQVAYLRRLRSTQPFILNWWINRVPAEMADSAGVRAGDAASVGWQVTLCDPI